MTELVVLVLNDPGKLDRILDAWLSAGVTGVTLLDSTGLAHQAGRHGAKDDLPFFPSLRQVMRGREESHCTLFAVVPKDFDVDGLAARTERITGTLDEPDTGIMFTMPVTRAWGLRR